jgi:hypothetical protein
MTRRAFDDTVRDLVVALLRAAAGGRAVLSEVPTASGLVEALQFAVAHRVEAALAAGARRMAESDPRIAAIAPFLEGLETTNGARNRRFRAEAERVVALLSEASVPCVVLKGAAVLVTSHDAAPWRQLDDLDLLVPPTAVREAAHVLKRAGFEVTGNESFYDPRLHHHHVGLYHPELDVLVELHTRLMQSKKDDLIPTNAVFERSVMVGAPNRPIRVPCPEHRMVHLVAHAQISDWGFDLCRISLKDLLDARMLEKHHSIDWTAVEACFVKIGKIKALRSFSWALDSLLGANGVRLMTPEPGEKEWAARAVHRMTEPEASWLLALRIGRCYLRHAWQSPERLSAQARTLFDPARRRHWLAVTRSRVGRGTRRPNDRA